jgi:hypothetical protein
LCGSCTNSSIAPQIPYSGLVKVERYNENTGSVRSICVLSLSTTSCVKILYKQDVSLTADGGHRQQVGDTLSGNNSQDLCRSMKRFEVSVLVSPCLLLSWKLHSLQTQTITPQPQCTIVINTLPKTLNKITNMTNCFPHRRERVPTSDPSPLAPPHYLTQPQYHVPPSPFHSNSSSHKISIQNFPITINTPNPTVPKPMSISQPHPPP